MLKKIKFSKCRNQTISEKEDSIDQYSASMMILKHGPAVYISRRLRPFLDRQTSRHPTQSASQ